MSGKPKQGIDFAGWDVDMFDSDEKIDLLLEAQGWNGFAVYFYICQKAYGTEGYFYRWSAASSAVIARRMGAGIRSETVMQTVNTCLRIGLFDDRLFAEGVLTSRGIQKRYLIAIEKRRVKTAIQDYWLLNKKESAGLVLVPLEANLRPANEHLQSANGDLLPANATKESKGKEIDEEEDARAREAEDALYLDSDWVKFVKVYEQNIGSLPFSPIALETMQSDFNDLGYDLMVEAVRVTVKRHGYNPPKLFETICREWVTKGIRTLDKARAAVLDHDNKTSGGRRNAVNGTRETRQPKSIFGTSDEIV